MGGCFSSSSTSQYTPLSTEDDLNTSTKYHKSSRKLVSRKGIVVDLDEYDFVYKKD